MPQNTHALNPFPALVLDADLCGEGAGVNTVWSLSSSRTPPGGGAGGVEAVTIQKVGARKSEKGDLVRLGVTRRSGKASRRR